jgi:tetratricopeptide (TPR) repeat protein
MILFGAHDPGDLQPVNIRKIDWSRNLPDLRKKEKPKKAPKKRHYNYKRLVPIISGTAIVLILLFFSGLLFPNVRSIFSPRLTITPITWTPSVDPGLQAALTGTPNPILQIPIGQVLEEPYTPTPVYVMTPHPGYGSYQSALEAYRQGDFETMLTYMRSTVDQLETPDIVYLVGEALRNLGRYNEAMEEYERVLFLDPKFAPAYFSRALISPILDPETDIKNDLDQALLLDPEFGQAYIERARYYLENDSYQLAYQDASEATDLLPESHLAYFYQAQALFGLRDYTGAEEAIYRSLQLDINYVPAYLLAGMVNLENKNPGDAFDLLTRYEPYDPNKGWEFYYYLGKAVYLIGEDLTQAKTLLTEAVTLGGDSNDILLTRALVNRDLGNLDQAISDAFLARDLDRSDYSVNQYLGELLYQNNQFSLALIYLTIAEDLALNESDFAKVYYWRALTQENLGNFDRSIADWENLVSLPLIYVPDEWEILAAEKLLPTSTPSPTATYTPTNTPTNTPTATDTPTATLTPTSSDTPTPIFTPSLTPSVMP